MKAFLVLLKIILTLLIIAIIGILAWGVIDKFFIVKADGPVAGSDGTEYSKPPNYSLDGNPDPNDWYYGWTNNGGYYRDELELIESLPDTPVFADIYSSMNVAVWQDYVCFYKYVEQKGAYIVPNALFYKVNAGTDNEYLIHVGGFNIGCKVKFVGGFLGIGSHLEYTGYSMYNNGDNFSMKSNLSDDWTKLPYYSSVYRPYLEYDEFGIGFWDTVGNIFNGDAWSTSAIPIWDTMYFVSTETLFNHFTKFDGADMSMISLGKEFHTVESFYNSIYEKLPKVNGEYIVDISTQTSVVIDNQVYKNNCFLKLTAKNNDKKLFKTANNVDETVGKHKEPVVDDTVEFSKLTTIKLVQTNGNDLTGFDITQAPVVVKLQGTTLDSVGDNKQFTFDTVDELKNGIQTRLLLGNYNIQIDSPVLDFKGGNFSYEIKPDFNGKLNFNYDYLQGNVLIQAELGPIRHLDLSDFDITNTPVVITLTNQANTSQQIQFRFDTQNKLDNGISQLVPMGTYNYSILSDGLIFATKTGTITFNLNNRAMRFNYDYNIIQGVIEFVYKSHGADNTYDGFNLAFTSAQMQTLGADIVSVHAICYNFDTTFDDINLTNRYDNNTHFSGGPYTLFTANKYVQFPKVDGLQFVVTLSDGRTLTTSVMALQNFLPYVSQSAEHIDFSLVLV